MRQVEHIMGMPVSLDVPEAKNAKVFEAAFKTLRDIDEQFSPFKTDSELSKYQRGEISEKEASQALREIINACEQAKEETDGYFSADLNSKFDPTGYVKGWAIKKASEVVEKKGFRTYCIGAGGDILASSDGDKEWRIGIENPLNQKYLTSKVFFKNGAVATSGTYRRGKHIINPFTKKPANEFLSVTVIGPDIIRADVLATAVFAVGSSGLLLVEGHAGYEALAVAPEGDIYMTSGMEKLLAN